MTKSKLKLQYSLTKSKLQNNFKTSKLLEEVKVKIQKRMSITALAVTEAETPSIIFFNKLKFVKISEKANFILRLSKK